MSFLENKNSIFIKKKIAGDLLIIIAQIITACQIVYEEKFLLEKDIPPLQAVGWEGIDSFFLFNCSFEYLIFVLIYV